MVDDIPGLRRILKTSKVIAVVGLSGDCFRKTEDIMPIAEDAIAIGAKVLWQQLGVKNTEAAKKAEAAGLEAVMDRCVKIEHGRLFGGLNWCGVNTKVISSKRPQWLPY